MQDGEGEPIQKPKNRTPERITGGIPWRSHRCALSEAPLIRRVHANQTHLSCLRQSVDAESVPHDLVDDRRAGAEIFPISLQRIRVCDDVGKEELFMVAASLEAVRV